MKFLGLPAGELGAPTLPPSRQYLLGKAHSTGSKGVQKVWDQNLEQEGGSLKD